ncbi:MAG: rod-binding protein [Armatimonadota bacterium]|nr:rod-binding protein [bacterium]MDW8321427.1 rod-binding protein [Armatimonadota bacterium]
MRVQPRSGMDFQRWRLREAARQVEAQFLHQLLRAMRRTVSSTPSSYATQMYNDMVDEALAWQLAQSERFGVGKMLFEKLSPYLQTPERVSGGTEDEQTG